MTVVPEPAVAPGLHRSDWGQSDTGGTDAAGCPSTVLAEQIVDLQEYGLSLGVDIDAEEDEDLSWAVQEAFNAPLPGSWTEYMDSAGRAYYIKEGSSQSTWEHPMDCIYRELFELVRRVRAGELPNATEVQREEIVREHLKCLYQRAKTELRGWSGPYSSDQGEYYYNTDTASSSWASPVAEWEQEFAIRHAVLYRCLLPEQFARRAAAGGSSPGGAGGADDVGGGGRELLQAFRLQLADLRRELPGGDVPQTPSTTRTFHTAKSVCSSRSGGRSHHRSDGKDRKNRKEHKDRKERRGHDREHHREGGGSAARCDGAGSGTGCGSGSVAPEAALPDARAPALLVASAS